MLNRRLAGLSVAVAVGVLLGWGVLSYAQTPAGKGSITGRIVGLDDKPVAGLALRLERFVPHGADGGPGARSSLPGGSGSQGLMGGRTIIGKGTTDKDGKFTMTNIEAGGGTLIGGGPKIGWLYHDVNIEANKETNVGDMKLVKTD